MSKVEMCDWHRDVCFQNVPATKYVSESSVGNENIEHELALCASCFDRARGAMHQARFNTQRKD